MNKSWFCYLISVSEISIHLSTDSTCSDNNIHCAINTVLNTITKLLMKIYGGIAIRAQVLLCTRWRLAVIRYTLLSASVTKDTTGIRGRAPCVSACHR